MGDLVLSYYDSLLKNRDIELLKDGNWINDNLIGFHFEYLANDMFKDNMDCIGLVSPEVVQFIKLGTEDDVTLFIEPLQLKEKELILLPINNNTLSEAAGGSHWSLLVFDKREGEFYHFDSFHGSNQEQANNVLTKLSKHINGAGRQKGSSPKCMEPVCSQQVNGYDCGMYVICFSELLCKSYCHGRKVSEMEIKVSPDTITQRRHDLKRLIYSLQSEG